MRMTSKTGLLPTIGKSARNEVQETITFEMPKLAVPAPLTLRPFAGVYNPFPYGCSILCNHPADFEAKTIVKRAKNAWVTEGKSLIDLEEVSLLRLHDKVHQSLNSIHKDDKVPEEFFRKYTDKDSRPITPAPTLASTTTKTSHNMRIRRCMTPDPTSFITTKEKTLLVLDLRRSHSQETICWQGSKDFDLGAYQEESNSRTTSPSCQSSQQAKKKKMTKKKQISTSGTVSSLKSENSRDSDSKTKHSSGNQSPSKGSLIELESTSKQPQLSPQSSSDDIDITRRRGKKRKGKKTGKGSMKEGDKEFKGLPDPNETQVSAFENDSRETSSKASLTGEENTAELQSEETHVINLESKPEVEIFNKSFLQAEILKQLQRQLDQEVVDSELNAKRKMALKEALRCQTNPKNELQGEEMKNLKKEFQFQIKNSEKWLTIPRVFTRRSARFELPMDSRLLNNMTPLHYVQNYVFASQERLVLYNHVFNLYKEEPEDDEETERVLLGRKVVDCLGKIMGRPMKPEESRDFQNLLDWKDEENLDFRTFAGISAACERLMGPQFCSKMPTQEEDPRHEIERADFETLDGKLLRLNPDRRLVRILKSIRDL